MKVSVIIPSHNGNKKVETAVYSVMMQTLKPLEVIIIDDGSNVPIEINQTNYNYIDVEIINYRFTESKGACAARNKGVELSQGDIIMFLDDDDTWETTKIEDQLHIFNNPQVGLVYSGRKVVLESNRNKIMYNIYPKHEGYLYPRIFKQNMIGTTSSVAVRKKLFLDAGGFDVDFPALQDYDLWIRCSKLTYVSHDNKLNVRYTLAVNAQTQISGHSSRHIIAINNIINKYKNEIVKLGFLQSRKVYSALYFRVAKSKRRKNLLGTLPWIFKSFLTYPNIRAVALLLPSNIVYGLLNKKVQIR